MKKYPLSLSADYCSGWTPANALREILQNALDTAARFEYCFDGSTLEITSKGVELSSSTLLLGNSGKRDDPTSVGGFGEGYKIALLILVREGFDVVVRNGSKLWVPSYEYSDLFECEVLTITETPLSGNSDLTFVINGVTDDLKSDVIHDCLYLQDDIGEVVEGSTGRVLKDIKGKLYVGGLFVSSINGHRYSYDFKPEYLPLNRDRKSVSSWDLGVETSRLIKEVIDPLEIAELVEKNSQDIQYLQNRNQLEDIADTLYERLVEKHGEDVVVCEWVDAQTDLEKMGYTNVVNVSHSNYHNIVKKSPKYQEKLEQLTEELDEVEEEKTPIEMLEDWWRAVDNCIETADINAWSDLIYSFKDRGISFDK